MTSSLSTPRARLLEARDHLSTAFEIVDEIAPSLPEPERGALTGPMGAKWELARLVRQISNIATMLATSEASR